MVAPSLDIRTPARARPRVWGLTPEGLHERFWAARGVAVVYAGGHDEVREGAELYLLADPGTLVLFRLRPLVDLLSWTNPQVLYVRVRNARGRNYHESAVVGPGGAFVRFERRYGRACDQLTRVALTTDAAVARAWAAGLGVPGPWRGLRRSARRLRREYAKVTGRTYQGASDAETAAFVRDLMETWKRPDSTIPDVREVGAGVWAHESARVDTKTRFIGSAWIGAGRDTVGVPHVLGPASLWDDEDASPVPAAVPRWSEIEPRESFGRGGRSPAVTVVPDGPKRLFDLLFAACALVLTLPLYPLVMLAIWLEDGRPFFFSHRRETRGGREFGCVKFRTMRKDADDIKKRIAAQNQADGPQFYMEHDPRVTRIGRLLRKLNVDELPQFLNVLAGHMSVVGPRPSPRKENQCCPSWREARLSVRPGITGLWQVSRTRQQGLDFQEWIKYDLEYVRRRGWRLDIRIILQTILMALGRGKR